MIKRQYYKGHKISKGEKQIAQFFDSYNINYTREQTFKKCVNHNNNLLRFDFYLEQFNVLIEFQGHHHYAPINKYRRAKIVYESTVIHDAIKEKFAFDNQINLIKIHYKDYEKIEEILLELLNEIELENGGEG
jgi:hypothetical protein